MSDPTQAIVEEAAQKIDAMYVRIGSRQRVEEIAPIIDAAIAEAAPPNPKVSEMATKCRRCSECPNSPHHWIESMFPYDDEEWEPGDYGCKHCDVRGVCCPLCGGDGKPFDDDPEMDGLEFCPECDGWGVIVMDPDMIGEAEKDRSEALHRMNPAPHYLP